MGKDAQVDCLFRNGLVYDGQDRPPYLGSVGFADGKILCVVPYGAEASPIADEIIELDGLAIAPGFIDSHTHDDAALFEAEAVYPKLSQGVTTVVAGNCGISLPPLVLNGQPPLPPMNLLGPSNVYKYPTMLSYRTELERRGFALNLVYLIGHMALRLNVMDDTNRVANSGEIETMHALLRQAMDEGASGFSTGLFYSPNRAANEEEVIAVAKGVGSNGGIYTTHMRDEGDDVLGSIEESVSTAKAVSLPLLISHHKCTGKQNWGRTSETLPLLQKLARDNRINIDAYPYTAGSTVLRTGQITKDNKVVVTWSESHPEMSGRDLSAIAADWGVSRIEAAERLMPAGAIYFQMHEDDVQNILQSDMTIIGSDGIPADRHPHPRLWGTFPRVLGRYGRNLGLFSMSRAIYKMTGMSAQVFGLGNRGSIKPGYAADFVIFDSNTIIDNATYDDPTQPGSGIRSVWVNGQCAWSDGRILSSRAGQLLKSEYVIKT